MTEKILTYLKRYAPFAGMVTEFVGVSPGCCGLFPQGEQVVSTHKDLLGNQYLNCRYVYHIRYRAVPGLDAVQLGEKFGNWLNTQKFSEQMTIRWQNARLLSRDQTGTALYQGELVLTYLREMCITQ